MNHSTARALEPTQTTRLVKQIVEQHLNGKEFDPQKSLELSQEIADLVLAKLSASSNATPNELHRYKYVVNCCILKHGSGLTSSSACLWDSTTDAAICVESELKTMDCSVCVYAIAFN